MKKITGLVSFALAGILTLRIGACYFQKSADLVIPPRHVYNSEEKVFLPADGGIDEEFLNKSLESKDIDKYHVYFLEEVDTEENNVRFLPLNIYEHFAVTPSTIDTIITAYRNISLIQEVDNCSIDDLEDRYLPLKRLLDKLNKVNDKGYYQDEKITKMYKIISRKVSPGNFTVRARGLEKVIREGGDCNDLSAAYFSLLNYYGIKTDIIGGRVIYEDKSVRLYNWLNPVVHAWIKVKTEEGYIDLDPYWHYSFAPLENRNPKIKPLITFSDDYLEKIRKK